MRFFMQIPVLLHSDLCHRVLWLSHSTHYQSELVSACVAAASIASGCRCGCTAASAILLIQAITIFQKEACKIMSELVFSKIPETFILPTNDCPLTI